METTETENDIEAYAPFRYTIAMITFRCQVFVVQIAALMAEWTNKNDPQPAEHHYYYENEGGHGYSERVVPPLFKLSPFFSDAG
jgi:hypothetical protein